MNPLAPANSLPEARLAALAGLSEWQKLFSHFDLAPDSFAFIPVFVPDSDWAAICQKSLAEFLRLNGAKRLLEILPATPDELKNLASALFDAKPGPDTGAVWIAPPIPFNEKELADWQAAWREGLARLNQYRNPLRGKFAVPLLLVGADWAKPVMRDLAPDLWSVRTIIVNLKPPAITLDEIGREPTPPALENLNAAASFDPDFAWREAAKLRGQPGKETALARALLRANQGFWVRARYREALAAAAEAGEVLERLVAGGRTELAHDLAMAYANRAIARETLEQWDAALADYAAALALRQPLVTQAGRSELRPELVRIYWCRLRTLLKLERRAEAAADAWAAWELTKEAQGNAGIHPAVQEATAREFAEVSRLLRERPPAERELIYAALTPEQAAVLRGEVEE